MSVQIIKGFIRADQSNESRSSKAPNTVSENNQQQRNTTSLSQGVRTDAALISLTASTRTFALQSSSTQRLSGFRDAEKLADDLSQRIVKEGNDKNEGSEGAHKGLGSVAGEKHLVGP